MGFLLFLQAVAFGVLLVFKELLPRNQHDFHLKNVYLKLRNNAFPDVDHYFNEM